MLDQQAVGANEYSSASPGVVAWNYNSPATGKFALIVEEATGTGSADYLHGAAVGLYNGYDTSTSAEFKLQITSIPEASTWAMLGLGFGAFSFVGFRRRKATRYAI